MGKNMEIAKGIEDEDYKKLNLDLNDFDNNDWDTAFDFLKKRLLRVEKLDYDDLRDSPIGLILES